MSSADDALRIKDMPSPNFDDRDGSGIDYLIFHYTGMKNAQSALDRLTDPDSRVSAHYTVDEDGTIYRHVAEDKRAWHAGASYWKGSTGINNVSIGIEIVHPGHEFGYRSFSAQQIESVVKLSNDIKKRYDLDLKNMLGHSDIAPDRKEDPGELFPWALLAQQGIGVWPDISKISDIDLADFNVQEALLAYGYNPAVSDSDRLIAFQRHFVPEVFETNEVEQETKLTMLRLHTLLLNRKVT